MMDRRNALRLGAAAALGQPLMGLGSMRARAEESLPKVPVGRDPGGMPVAYIGSGVNYTLPEIAQRLARDGEGEIIGLDMETGQMRPFDRWSGPDGMLQHPGTALASLMLREAGAATLIAIRQHPAHPESLAVAVAMIQRSRARIVLLPASSPREADFLSLRQAVEKAGDVLLVAPAGDGLSGNDVEAVPSYPAAFGLANVLVVTACDASGRLLAGSSWGAGRVDVALPAQDLEATDYSGAQVRVSGEPFAVARAAALAARLKAVHPHLSGAALKAKLLENAAPNPAEPVRRTRAGWIANPKRIAWLG